MIITILNGKPGNSYSGFNDFLIKISKFLEKESHRVKIINLEKLNIEYCRGCFSCWTKTPGKCIFDDDMSTIYPDIINTDLLIFASPLIMGFTSALLKSVQDRLIPLIHPYFEIINDEFHHKKRYENYPKLGLLVEKEETTDGEDLEIIADIYKRLALNFRSELKFSKTMASSEEDIINAINNI